MGGIEAAYWEALAARHRERAEAAEARRDELLAALEDLFLQADAAGADVPCFVRAEIQVLREKAAEMKTKGGA